MQSRVEIEFDVPATMRDGTALYANVYRPKDDGRYPVLLARLPYDKNGQRDAAYFDVVRATRRGYIVVIQDVRGRFASEGEFESFPQESQDGYDSVEWAAKLPGSNGVVGMWGLSYYGKTQWHAATQNPPSLKAIAPGQTWGNHLNGASLRGGAQELGLVHSWAQASIAPNHLTRKYAAKPEDLREGMLRAAGIVDELARGGGFQTLPYSELPDPEGLDGKLHLGSDVSDEFWNKVNLDDLYARVTVPTLHIGGWYDCFIGETLRQYAAMRRLAEVRGTPPPRLVVGPWTHADFTSFHGDLDFGVASTGAALDLADSLTDIHLRFFDATLKGDGEALADEPPVKVFVMGENRWRNFWEWPPPEAQNVEYYLAAGGALSTGIPAPGEADYDHDPLSPVPTLGGQTLLAPVYGSGAVDQSRIESRDDVLIFTSGVLEEDVTILGSVYATLFAASSAPDTDFVVRLTDVHPDGGSIVVTDGIVRASARATYSVPEEITAEHPSPIESGRIYEYVVDMWQTATTFEAGHRLRVHVTSSCFPRWDTNTVESGHTSGETRIAHQTIRFGNEYRSRVTLPVVRGTLP